MKFDRYAIYYTPQGSLAEAGAAWLGWDVARGRAVAHPEVAGLDVAALTQTPRKYGLHATMKPPMRLATGTDEGALRAACAALAATRAPVRLEGLQVERLGRFLALRPLGDVSALNALAAACVTELDTFRAPAPDTEIEKRRAAGLSTEQDRNLIQWGYPYVLDQFRFHITLTGKLPKGDLPAVEDYLATELAPLLPQPFEINDLALMGEAEDGRFHLIQRYPLLA